MMVEDTHASSKQLDGDNIITWDVQIFERGDEVLTPEDINAIKCFLLWTYFETFIKPQTIPHCWLNRQNVFILATISNIYLKMNWRNRIISTY